ncbi:MAG TPA: wax ester/triacylglycerol synthase family O-acyltransferase [Acidimicrobiales bacterium]|nr:wax ester/triacylglycerol synthase family O-acyltransferase [Acidimicrobiales bacterium]
MERLSGLDSAFLSLESSSMHLHVAIAAVIDPSTMAQPYAFDDLKSFICRRLMRDRAFRRRVVEVPFRLNHPLWIEDPNLDLDYHIRRHVLPSPGGPRELTDLVGRVVGVPLDRSRPLWEIHVVEGLYDGNVALIGKIHHAAVDGVSGAELFVHLFDLTPHPPDETGADEADVAAAEPPPPPVERIPSEIEMVGHALLSQARRALSLPALLGRTVATATQLVGRHRDPETVVGAVPLRAPRTPWSAAITPHRSVAFARVSLSDIKRVRAAFGVKVNDVVLALVSDALRRYLVERSSLPRTPLVAMCPVSVRTEDERGRPDNRVSGMFVHLRTDMADVAQRLRAIARTTRGAKEDHNAVGAKFIQNWAEQAAPSTFVLATRLYSRLNIADRHRPIYNVVVSNVPGPDFPLYLDGAELVATYPMGPVMEGAGLNVTVLSYLDNVDFGFLAGAELVPDVWDMADVVTEAMDDLLAAADEIDPPTAASDPIAADVGGTGSTAGAAPAGSGSSDAPSDGPPTTPARGARKQVSKRTAEKPAKKPTRKAAGAKATRSTAAGAAGTTSPNGATPGASTPRRDRTSSGKGATTSTRKAGGTSTRKGTGTPTRKAAGKATRATSR